MLAIGPGSWGGVFEDPEDSSISTIATVRKLRATDKALLQIE